MAHCPNLSNPQVKKDFNSIVGAVGNSAAYALWDKNNGNPMHMDPDGNPSTLFQQLLDKTGSIKLAIRAKARVYTDSYLRKDNWITEGVEPLLSQSDIKEGPIQKEEPVKEEKTDEVPPNRTADKRKMLEIETVLKKALPFVEKVVYDDTLNVTAQVESGGKTITVNPTLMQDETLGHEYGHVLIDLMGGMKSPFIQRARKQLIGSTAEERVTRNYPEDKGTEKFEKEIVATAIGTELADLFKERESRNKFAQWLLEFFRKLRNTLGISRNDAQTLAGQLAGNKRIKLSKLKGTPSTYTQQSREDAIAKLDKVAESSENINLTEDKKFYLVTLPTKTELLLERTSRVLEILNLSMSEEEGEEEAVQYQSKLGDVVHDNMEGIANGSTSFRHKDGEDYKNIEISPEAFAQMAAIYTKLFAAYYVKAEVKVADPNILSAGTADILAVNSEGEHVIFDYKTKRKYKAGKTVFENTDVEQGYKHYNSPYQAGGESQRNKNSAQLTLYKEMFNIVHGLNIKEAFIVPLITNAEKRGDTLVITSVELETNPKIITPELSVIKVGNHNRIKKLYTAREEAVSKDAAEKGEDIPLADLKEQQKLIQELRSSPIEDLSPLEKSRKQAISFIVSRINRDKLRNREGSVETLMKLLEVLENSDVTPEAALLQFVENARHGIESMYETYQKLKVKETEGDKNAFSLSLMQRWHEITNAYGALDDIAAIMIDEGFSAKEAGISKKEYDAFYDNIKDLLVKKTLLNQQFSSRGVDIEVESLAPFITRVEAELKVKARDNWIKAHIKERKKYTTKEWEAAMNKEAMEYAAEHSESIRREVRNLLRSEMQKASLGDITLMQRYMDTALNSPDLLVAVMVKKFSIVFQDIRMGGIEYGRDMSLKLGALEEALGYNTNMAPEKFYEFMLERIEGKLTGYLTMNISSALQQAKKDMIESTKKLEFKERKQLRKEWFSENMPLNYSRFNKAYERFLSDLKKDGKITQEELNQLKIDNGRRYDRRKGVGAIVKDLETADKISRWSTVNTDRFSRPAEKWENPQWKTLEKILENKSDPRTIFYDHIIDTVDEMDEHLPDDQQLRGQLPFQLKTNREMQLSGETYGAIAKKTLDRWTQLQADETERGTLVLDENGKPIREVPVYYKRVDETYDPEMQSYDLGSLFTDWHSMAFNYKGIKSILSEMEWVQTILDTRDYAYKDASGNIVNKAVDDLADMVLSKKDGSTNVSAQFGDFMSSIVYGQAKVNEGNVNILGFRVDKAQMLDTLGTYTAYNMLGLNLLQGVNNVSLGEIQNIIEGFAGQFYDISDLHVASKYYWNGLKDVVGDIGERRPESLLGQMIEKWDILNEYQDGNYRKNSKFSRLMKFSTVFFVSHAGEHFMQSRIMLAMLSKIRAKDKNGKDIGSMLDMYELDENKNMKLSDKVDREKSDWSLGKETLFGEKVKRLLAGMHGEYSLLGRNAVQRYALGRLGIMFRKFGYPGFKRRWGKKYYNEILEVHMEGAYSTFNRFALNFFKDWKRFSLAVASENWSAMHPEERANIRRTTYEVLFLLGITLSATALLGIASEDDDKESSRWFLDTSSYLALRLAAELRFFWDPFAAMQILRSPAASLSSIEYVTDFMQQLLFHPTEQYSREGPYKYKLTKKFIKTIPIAKQYFKIRDVGDILKMLVM